MFNVDYKEATFDNLNTRTENHGDEIVPAVDVKLTFAIDADELKHFHPDLKPLLFAKYQPNDDDLFDEQEEQNEHVIDWRFREIHQIPWDYEGAGYRFVIWKALQDDEAEEMHPSDRREDVVLINTKLRKFKFSPLKGSLIEVSCSVAGCPNAKDVGRLFELQRSNITITLEPPRMQ